MDKERKPNTKFEIQMQIVPYNKVDLQQKATSNFQSGKSHPLHERMAVRILYKGRNRNDSFIDDNVEQLIIDTLPNTPIVGEYWESVEDFGTHGMEVRSDEKGNLVYKRTTIPYGVIPEGTEVWHELVTDTDGVERNYLCCEVVLWSKRYKEVSDLVESGRPQSMELDPDTINGEWIEAENGYDYYFKYSTAYLSALCILGSDIEPCFEGASFVTFSNQNGWSDFKNLCQEMFNDIKANYELESITKKIDGIEKIAANFELDNSGSSGDKNNNDKNNAVIKDEPKIKVFTTGLNLINKGGKFNMGEIKLQFSGKSDIRETIYKSINSVNAEGEVYDFKYSITEVKSDSFVAFNYQDNKYYKFDYTMTGDELKIGAPVSVYANFPTKEEKEKVDQSVQMYSIKEAEIVKLSNELKEVKSSIKDYNLTKAEFEVIKSDADSFNAVKTELETLRQFRDKTEMQSKLDILEKFSVLGEAELKVFKENISKYTAEELDEKLSVVAFRKNVSLTKKEVEEVPSHVYTFNPDPAKANKPNNVPSWFSLVQETDSNMLNLGNNDNQ